MTEATPGTPAATTDVTTPAATPAAAWTEGFAPEDMQFIQAKGFQSPAELAKSARNAQSLIGEFGALPKELRDALKAAPAEDAKAIALKALGFSAPETADKYSNPLGAAYGDEVFKAAATKAHELGLTDAQFTGLVGLLPTMSTDVAMKQAETRAAEVTAWQQTNAAEAMQVRVLLTNAGVQGDELADFLAGAGIDGLKVLTKVAAGTTEKPVIAAGDTSPEGAASRKAQMMSDPTFQARLRSNDMKVRAGALRDLAAINMALNP